MLSYIEQSLNFSEGCLRHISTRFPHGCTLLRVHSALVPARPEDTLVLTDGSASECQLFKVHEDNEGFMALGGSFDKTILPLTLRWVKATPWNVQPRKDASPDSSVQSRKKLKVMDEVDEQGRFGQLTIRYTVEDADVAVKFIQNKVWCCPGLVMMSLMQ
jgi:hypothetical protein